MQVGHPADFCLVDLEAEWEVGEHGYESRSENCCFSGRTLRGRVLPIGGLKEKLLAALRGGITTVLIPSENEKDLAEIPATVKENLEIVPVSHVDEVLARALTEPVEAIEWTEPDEHATEPVVHPHASSETAAVRH